MSEENKSRELTLIGCCDKWGNTHWAILNIAEPMSEEIGNGFKFIEKSAFEALEARHAKLLEAMRLAEEVITHPAVYCEAELRSESLKIRRDKFMNALEAIEADKKANEK